MLFFFLISSTDLEFKPSPLSFQTFCYPVSLAPFHCPRLLFFSLPLLLPTSLSHVPSLLPLLSFTFPLSSPPPPCRPSCTPLSFLIPTIILLYSSHLPIHFPLFSILLSPPCLSSCFHLPFHNISPPPPFFSLLHKRRR